MADGMDISRNDGDANQEEQDQNGRDDKNLADFVTRNYERQREARQQSGIGNDVSEDRVDRFLERALSESQRMNAEVARSERRQNDLYRELGQDKIHSWTMEHASEVIVSLPQQPSDDVVMDVEGNRSGVNGSSDHTDVLR